MRSTVAHIGFWVYNIDMSTVLTAGQADAENLVAHWFYHSDRQTFVLTGFAGTGKTALLRHAVCERLELVPDVSAAFVTPTGKAATVLIKKGIPACTVHRLIYQSIAEEQEIMLNGKKVKIEKLTFRRRENIDKRIKLIVLDEASMVSDEVLFDILNFGVKVLLCGDDCQLPPVEGLNSYLHSPDATLTEIVRQEQGNPIIHLSSLAREGRAVVLVLHDLCLAMKRADRLAILADGALAALGAPEEIFTSGVVDRVFGVSLRRVETDSGWQYYFA